MAITASFYNNICYSTVVAAQDAYFSHMPVSLVAGVTQSYQLEYLPNGIGGWTLRKLDIDNAGNATMIYNVAVTPPLFPECDNAQFFTDGMQMGWGVVGAMVAAFSVIFLKKAFFR